MIQLTLPQARRVCHALEEIADDDICRWFRGLVREARQRQIERIDVYPGGTSFDVIEQACKVCAPCDKEESEEKTA